jgi:hypothetical protein
MSAAETPQSTGPTFPAAMADPERQTAGGKVPWHFRCRWTASYSAAVNLRYHPAATGQAPALGGLPPVSRQ